MNDVPSDHLDRAGASRAPAVILLHPGGVNRCLFEPALRVLGARFHVLAPDLPGHGTRAGMKLRLERAVAVVRALLDGLSSPAVLAGDSLGGYVAVAAAAEVPTQAAGVVAAGCTLDPVGATGLLLRVHWLKQRAGLAAAGTARSAARAAAVLRAQFPQAPWTEIERVGLSPRGAADGLRATAGHDFSAMLRAYGGPVLLVNGERDRAARRHEQRFVAASRSCELAILPGMGHGVSLHDVVGFARLVEHFASRIL